MNSRIKTAIKKLKGRRGASAVEYALIAGLVAVVLIATLSGTGSFGSKFTSMFDRLGNQMDTVAPETTP